MYFICKNLLLNSYYIIERMYFICKILLFSSYYIIDCMFRNPHSKMVVSNSVKYYGLNKEK